MLLYEVDFFAFMGQSNMAGRGIAEQAPTVPQGHGYEFRAITEPSTLHPITEPFGKDENLLSGIYEPGMKTGSLVSDFVNSCYQQTGVPIVGVSASKGGSSIAEWAPGSSFYSDAASRTRQCLIWLQNHHINVRHRSMVWCQGCTDGDLHTDPEVYYRKTRDMLSSFREECGLTRCFLIRIGNHRDLPALYVPIQEMQEKLAREDPDVILVSRCFASFAAKGLMKDTFHYLQEGYNLAGEEAGTNTGRYLQSLSSQPDRI